MSALISAETRSDGEAHRHPVRQPRWYLVQTHTGKEAYAQAHLKRQGYRTFLPLTWRTIRHARRISSVKSAYFPSYLFVSMDLTLDRWRPVESTLGVARLFKANGWPAPAPIGLVEHLADLTGGDGLIDRTAGSFREGQEVRVILGPFTDQIATIDTLGENDRVRVLLSIMGRSVSADVARSALSLA